MYYDSCTILAKIFNYKDWVPINSPPTKYFNVPDVYDLYWVLPSPNLPRLLLIAQNLKKNTENKRSRVNSKQ